MKICSCIALILICHDIAAQHVLTGVVLSDKAPVDGATVFLENGSIYALTDSSGHFELEGLVGGPLTVSVFKYGWKTTTVKLDIPSPPVTIQILPLLEMLEEVRVESQSDVYGMKRMNGVEGTGIYEAKKNEVIVVSKIQGNLAANTARQAYAKVPGLNIWENDGAGIQLGIGGRGLDPNRTSNFNVRQNGYDITADALGYPESYYTPPLMALSRIEIVRGAASLQYGTQFGGLLNFVFNAPSPDKPLEWNGALTTGSFGFLNAFNSLGGTVKNLDYYIFYDVNHSEGWRPNSESTKHAAYGKLGFKPSDKLKLGIEYTFNTYLAHQPGGLTDAQFRQDPRQSNRQRNWFRVDWNLVAATMQFNPIAALRFDYRFFYLNAGRDAVGNLSRIDRPDDPGSNRDLMRDQYSNWGMEGRVLRYFKNAKTEHAVLAGFRYYHGHTHRRQGDADNGEAADFRFLNPGHLEGSDFMFPGSNVALFLEDAIFLNNRWSLIPGIRYEYIATEADGYYRDIRRNLAGDILTDTTIFEYRNDRRGLLLGGLGASFKASDHTEVYANLSQNYRAINFNDIRVNNPSLRVDENLKDERGYNAELGVRGQTEKFNFDGSLFLLSYSDRIGNTLISEPDPRFNGLVDRTVRYRTNIADARIMGIELYGEMELFEHVREKRRSRLSAFANVALLRSGYLQSEERAVEGNQVELAPPVNIKGGISYTRNSSCIGIQASFVSTHFSDAANTPDNPAVPSAVEGTIPSYYVADFFTSTKIKKFVFRAGINNLTDNRYFTRRATGYPGPGIIPSDGRNLYLTLQVKL